MRQIGWRFTLDMTNPSIQGVCNDLVLEYIIKGKSEARSRYALPISLVSLWRSENTYGPGFRCFTFTHSKVIEAMKYINDMNKSRNIIAE